MSENQFFKEYSRKLDGLQPDNSYAQGDWQNILLGLNQKKTRKRQYLFLWLSLASAVLFSLIYLATNASSSDHKVVDQLNIYAFKKPAIIINTSPSTNLEQANNQNIETKNKIEKLKTDAISKNVIESRHDASKIVFNHTESLFSTISSRNTVNKSAYDIQNSGDNVHQYSYTVSNNLSVNHAMKNNTDLNEDGGLDYNVHYNRPFIDRLRFLPTLNNLQVTNNTWAESLNLPIFIFPADPIIKSNTKISARIALGSIFKTAKESSVHGHAAFIENISSAKIGFNLGLNVLYQKNNNWRFGIGLQRSQIEYTTEHSASINAANGRLLNPGNGEVKQYEYLYSINDGQSKSQVSLRLYEEIPNASNLDDIFNIEMSIGRKTTKWQIPFTIERRLFNTDKITLFAKAGTAFTVSSESTNTIHHFSETCKDLCFNHDFDPTISSVSHSNFLPSVILGLSTEFNLTKSLAIGLNPEFNAYHNRLNSSWMPQYSINASITYQFNKD